MADDLGTPLGARRKRPASRVRIPLLPLVTACLAGIIGFGLLWVVLVDDPLGGEPLAIVAIDSPAPDRLTTKASTSAAAEPKSASQTVTIIDGKSGLRRQIAVPGSDEPAAAATADARLVEPSRHGAIPRVAADGTRPLDAYARGSADKGTRVAVVIGGLGVGANITAESLAKLSDRITLAFVPYGNDVARWISRARAAGHETLLQIPMEPFDYPDNDPGPQTLLASLKPDQNLDRLHWVLSRAQGYVGVTNFMGARFTATESALVPLLREIANRGLLYFDDGSSPRSLVGKLAARANLPFVKADVVIDAKPNWADIDAALEALERLAATQGYAVGSATALPVTIERVARWMQAAEARGVRIVPISALVLKAKQS